MNEQTRDKGIGILLMLGILIIPLSFSAGYYWSRSTLAEDFLQLCLQDELSDKVAAAFYAREGDQVDAEEREQAHGHTETENDAEAENYETGSQGIAIAQEDQVNESAEISGSAETRRLYQAILIGFGEKRSADRYVAKLAISGIEARVVKRTGKSRRGREVVWYQVVTAAMAYDDLSNVIMQLKKTDRLEGVMIVESEKSSSDEMR